MTCYLHQDDFAEFVTEINSNRGFSEQLSVSDLMKVLGNKQYALAEHKPIFRSTPPEEMTRLTYENLEGFVTKDEFERVLAQLKSKKSSCIIVGGKKTKRKTIRKTMRKTMRKKSKKSRKYRK